MSFGLSDWLKKINLLKYSMKFIENGYNDLDQLRTMTADNLSELSSDVDFIKTIKNLHV